MPEERLQFVWMLLAAAGKRTDVKERAFIVVAADVDDMAILTSHDPVLSSEGVSQRTS